MRYCDDTLPWTPFVNVPSEFIYVIISIHAILASKLQTTMAINCQCEQTSIVGWSHHQVKNYCILLAFIQCIINIGMNYNDNT